MPADHPAADLILQAARQLKVSQFNQFESRYAELITRLNDTDAVTHLCLHLVDAISDGKAAP